MAYRNVLAPRKKYEGGEKKGDAAKRRHLGGKLC